MIIGTSLILRDTGEELQSWSTVPNTIDYKGEIRIGAIVGAEIGDDAILVHRVLDAAPPFGDPPVTSENSAYDGTKIVVTRTYGSVDLAPVRVAAKLKIDNDAEAAYMTGAGLARTYDRKRREALQAIDDPSPTAQKYPVLSASIGIEVPDTGNAKTDFDAISNVVIAKELQWAALARRIETLRLMAKKTVDGATSFQDIQTATQVEWP